MGIKTFNIDENKYDKFKVLYPREMSKMIEEFIDICISGENMKTQEIVNLEAELKDVELQIRNLKAKSYRLNVLIDEKKEAIKNLEKQKTKEELEVEKWAEDVIKDAKHNNNLTELTLEAEQEGLTVKELLIRKWNEAKK